MKILTDTTVGTIQLGDRTLRRLGFGAMRISSARNVEGVRDREEARRLCRRLVERGVQFIDTANIYGYGESEQILAEALQPFAKDLLIATKAGYRPGKILPGHQALPALGHPDHISEECDKSLARLGTDSIELYQLHVPDPNYPYADTLGAFALLQQAGKVQYIGVSNVSVEQLEIARSTCEIVSVQNRYNVGDRDSEAILATCERHGIVFLPWAPILIRSPEADAAISNIAKRHGASPQQVALRWLLHRSPSLLPIPGTSRMTHLDENIDAAWLDLTPDELAKIDALGEF